MATYCPGMQLVMVVPREDVMSSSGFGKEVCYFYEKQLARVSAHLQKKVNIQGPVPRLSSKL